MLTKYPLAIVTMCSALALAPIARGAPADPPPTSKAAESRGTVSGRVQNALSGNYLNNARVSVRGTERVVFTNEAGTYLIPDAPAGEIVLEVFYTGLDPQVITVQVPSGQRVERDVALSSRT